MALPDWTAILFGIMPLLFAFMIMFVLTYFIRYFGETLKTLTA